MDDDYIFCTQCGTKNPKKNKFCVKCGTKLVQSSKVDYKVNGQSEQFNSRLIDNGANNQNRDHAWLWLILGGLIILVLGFTWYQHHQEQERADIRSYVYNEFEKSAYKVKIDQDDKIVTIIPDSDSEKASIIYIMTEDADGDEADEYDEAVTSISEKIKNKIGDGWTVYYQNPMNSKRYLWIYKDGKCKYRIQDHTVSYDDDSDYGDEYDLDDDY